MGYTICPSTTRQLNRSSRWKPKDLNCNIQISYLCGCEAVIFRMAELGFQDQSLLRFGLGARDASPDSVIFTQESNFSLFSSASASVDRCSFASDVHDHDSLASEVSLVISILFSFSVSWILFPVIHCMRAGCPVWIFFFLARTWTGKCKSFRWSVEENW